ncbi:MULTISPECIES: dihydrofolate reductase family protein [Dyella]|uniref:Dihydrofolate reductase n=2 Tax=Dyella TaxID=231454 RepID=A0A4V2NM43_9GAMM|nr:MULTISPECIES: dihydrofolate reductase family protein [Dyella]TBR40531.1 dihydrofolate reductase [Dyella terrae]TCI11887.1 dihydrofolate reductase [Dyella soli]
MAKLIYELNVSLDGYIDHQHFGPPDRDLFRHFTHRLRELSGMVYGRGMYQVMNYWDDAHPEWDADERDYADAWRNQRKWVVSRTLSTVGPNATLIANDLEATMQKLKAECPGEIEVAGTGLAQSLTGLGLIDEYRLYLHPVVLGSGKPYFSAARSRLRLVAHEPMSQDVIRLTYVPA